MKTLQSIFNEIGNLTKTDYGANDKGGQIHTYLETYEKLFSPKQNGCALLEIGLAMGDSIKLWDEYFENSLIVGVDLSIIFEKIQYKNNVLLYASDATRPGINEVLGDLTFDIIIDDGSHMTKDQITTFNLLQNRMNPGGVYIIEDLLALDVERGKYMSLYQNCEIVDMRKVNGRFDNALAIYRF